MDRPQIPSQRGLVVEVLEAVVGLVRRRDVDEREADAGGDLQHEEDHGRAAEHVGPARGLPRDPMLHRELEDPADPRALLEPVTDRAEHCDHAGWDKVGIWPPRTQSLPARTSYPHSNHP